MRPVRQLRGRIRHPPPRNIGGRGAQDAGAIRDLADGGRRILRHAEEERHIQPLRRQIDAPVRQAQADIDQRIQMLERWHQRRDEPPPDPQRSRDMQRATRVAGDGLHRRFRLLDGIENPARPVIEYSPLLGRGQGAGGALE